MAGTELAGFKDGLVLLGTAGVVVPIMYRLNISPVLGFLLAGVLLGPHGLGSLVGTTPWLANITIADQDKITGFAELGVVFLLFVIGLELSLQRLITMRKMVFGLGTAQVVISSVLIGLVAYYSGQSGAAALVIGACMALSSTAVVLEILSQQKRLTSATGRASFSILLLQDLAVVPIIFLVGILGAKGQGSVFGGLLYALLQAIMVIAVIVVVGRFLLQPLYRLVAKTRSSDLFVATTLLVIIGTSILTASFGLSMALGAFVAGLLLAETEYRRAIEATIEPFKGLLLGVFFFSVGMYIDPKYLLEHADEITLAVAGLVLVNATVIIFLGKLFQLSWPTAIKTGLLLGAGGEFGFVVVNLALHEKLLTPQTGSFLMILTAISMALIPALDVLGRFIVRKLEPVAKAPDLGAAMTVPTPAPAGDRRALLIGYGRVGRMVASLMDAHKIGYIAIDHDPDEVARARANGHSPYFGDAMNEQFLRNCGIEDAPAAIITSRNFNEVDRIVKAVKHLRPDIAIVARARDADHARHLYEIGVTNAIPETIEASLQLGEAALFSLGIPAGPIVASIHEKRDEVRRELREAASAALKLQQEKH